METTLKNVRLLRQGQILKEWWTEVKENFWDTDARLKVKELLKMLMEQTLVEDLQLKRQKMAGPAYRNGYYPRSLVTQFGLIQELQVPRLRDDSFQTRVFGRYPNFASFKSEFVVSIEVTTTRPSKLALHF